MAAGTYSNFTIYDDEFYSSLNETLVQNTDAFNAASQNAITLSTEDIIGHFEKQAFFTSIGSSLINRRDVTSTSAHGNQTSLSSDDMAAPKLSRTSYVINNLDSLARIGAGPAEFSSALGEQMGIAMQVDFLNTAITCANGAVGSDANALYSALTESTTTMTHKHLISGLNLFGDSAGAIVAWVMHSKPLHDLLKESVDIATDRVAGATIYEGVAGTLGRPVVVTDSSDLVNTDAVTSGTDSYYTYGLTAGGVMVKQNGAVRQVSRVAEGNENLEFRVQSEYDFTLRVKGFDFTDTGVNPTDATLATTSNWNNVMDSIKSTAGIRIETA